MTQEEKQLLLVDLCARLPYGVKFQYIICDFCEPDVLEDVDVKREQIITEEISRYDIEEIKPYLRPMSSMTEEELDELLDSENSDFDGKSELVKRAMTAYIKGDKLLSNALFSMQYAKTIDWLNTHHFDYRGLIPMGLALEAPEGMYNTKTE